MLAQGPLRGALQFSPAPPRGLGLQRPSQSRSPNPSKSFSLRVRLEETGEIYRLSSCHGDTTVRELKEELDLMAGIPFHFQCILYLDQGILMDESTLGFHDVVPGGILSMCIWHQDGWQELVLAAMEGDTSANCLAKTPVGRTALHVAAAMGHVSCINLLLDYDAVLSEKDLKGETPIEIARRLKRKQSIQAFCMYQMKLRAAKLGSSQSNPHRSASLLFSKGQHIKS
uniref:Ankyrin repeat domain-containing protein 60 isoform X4 n=1 Tax=Phascolarctos cinereus TaxID=38626 RepID=A0A6P5JSE0_PHACI|nr:ankyrin repeat domain-containing protein 60 isoform X4 [Phascolarctos cinereus]